MQENTTMEINILKQKGFKGHFIQQMNENNFLEHLL